MTPTNDSRDILKLEYQTCRNKIDDLDNLLKDLRFRGIAILTGFIVGNSLLLDADYLNATLITSLLTIMLILQLWRYDHKYTMFLVGAVERAQEIENRLQDLVRACKEWYLFSIDGEQHLENELDKEKVPKELSDEFKKKKEKDTCCEEDAQKDSPEEWRVIRKRDDTTWCVTDGKRIYVLRKEGALLNVYREVKMLSGKLSDVYRALPGHIAITASFLYTLLTLIGLGILLYSLHQKHVPGIVMAFTAGFFILQVGQMWYVRIKAEEWIKFPSEKHKKA